MRIFELMPPLLSLDLNFIAFPQGQLSGWLAFPARVLLNLLWLAWQSRAEVLCSIVSAQSAKLYYNPTLNDLNDYVSSFILQTDYF